MPPRQHLAYGEAVWRDMKTKVKLVRKRDGRKKRGEEAEVSMQSVTRA